MRRVLDILMQPRHHAWIALLLAALVLLPRLGSYGFWEPREIEVADSARRWLEAKDPGEDTASAPDDPDRPAADRAAPGPRRSRAKAARETSRFTERLVAHGIDHGGYTELGARWPLALLGLIAVMAAYLLGARLAGPRAGLIGAIALLTTPYLILQSRQLTSDIAALTGSALVFLGLAGLALPERWRALSGIPGGGRAGGDPAGRRASITAGALVACDLAALLAGLVLCNEAAGLFLGVAPPLLGFGLGVVAWAICERRAPGAGERVPTLLVGCLALAGATAALALFLEDTFSWVRAADDQRQIFGWTFVPDRDPLPAFGGAAWREIGDVQTPFSALFEQIAFGLFPWIALAPFALGRLGLGFGARTGDGDGSGSGEGDAGDQASARAPWAGYALFAWAASAWLIGSIVVRHVGDILFPAGAAVAVAIGVWLEGLLARRRAGQGSSLPLVALFVLIAVLVLGKDIHASPEELTSLTAAGKTVKYPEGAALHHGVLLLGALFGLAAAAGLLLWRGPYRLVVRGRDLCELTGRYGLHAAVALAVAFALFLSHLWIPGLASRMSSRDVLARYRELRQEGDVLGLLGNLGSGPTYYAGGGYEKLKNRSDLIEFLKRPGRVFALTRSSELCPLYKESSKKEFRFHVVDDQHVQYMLLSNQLRDGEEDRNPLIQAIRRTPPQGIQKRLSVNFDDQIELIGVNMPRSVERGEEFEMTLFYKVLAPVKRPWKIFVHIDSSSVRINGDHAPIGGHCSTSYFQPGDYIVDRHTIKAGDVTNPKTTYRVWTGFFHGSGGRDNNMKPLTGNPDPDRRVPIGTIEVR
ncbi:MAG TPA: glycosyltransferase family 39 protein [Kofleriaceae bacterium]|nr:glycosyltransferase family 39 protein [Kofleriaceae bacterium]